MKKEGDRHLKRKAVQHDSEYEDIMDEDDDTYHKASDVPLTNDMEEADEDKQWPPFKTTYICDRTFIPPVLEQQTGCCGPTSFVDAVTVRVNQCLKATNSNVSLVLSAQSIIDCGGMSFGDKEEDDKKKGKKKKKIKKPPSVPNSAKYAVHRGLYMTSVYPYTGKKGNCKKPKARGVKISGLRKVSGDIRVTLMKVPLVGIILPSCCDEFVRIRGTRAREILLPPFKIPTAPPATSDAPTTPIDLKPSSHAVLVIGYGSNAISNFYVIKKSHGEQWGVFGYGRVSNRAFKNVFYYPVGPFEFTSV